MAVMELVDQFEAPPLPSMTSWHCCQPREGLQTPPQETLRGRAQQLALHEVVVEEKSVR